MSNELLRRLENIKNVTSGLNKSQLQYIGLFGNNDKYELYLFPEPTRNILLDWYDAINCAKILNGDLPTIVELRYLHDKHTELFTSTYYSNSIYYCTCYWSSTEDNSLRAKIVSFYTGATTTTFKNFIYRVRFVRRVYPFCRSEFYE